VAVLDLRLPEGDGIDLLRNMATLPPDCLSLTVRPPARSAAAGDSPAARLGGTLFLDEITEATLQVQTKLLRLLDRAEVLPVEATQPVRVRCTGSPCRPCASCGRRSRVWRAGSYPLWPPSGRCRCR